jgi:hypothetical protein
MSTVGTDFWISTAPEWGQAVAGIGTLVVAVFAAIYAARQVGEARRLREEQARPYVAAFLELSGESTLELVVKNFGATTARNVTMTSDKVMKRYWGGDEAEDLLTFDSLPVLVPGQDWRTLFDEAGLRMEKDTDAYTVVVRSQDSHGRQLPDEEFVLDWRTYQHKQYIGQRTLHDIGEALVKIERTVKDWSESPKGLSVVTRSGADKDRRQREFFEANRARHRKVQEASDELAGRSQSADTRDGEQGASDGTTPS